MSDSQAFVSTLTDQSWLAGLDPVDVVTARLLGGAIKILSLPETAEILPFLPQLIQQGLARFRAEGSSVCLALLNQFEQLARYSFADFERLTDSEEACDQTLLSIERVIIAALDNEFVAADIKAALRANRYMAERLTMTFCYSEVGRELLRLALTSLQRVGEFGDAIVYTSFNRDGEQMVRLTNGIDVFDFAWSGSACTLWQMHGNITLAQIEKLMTEVTRNWRPDDFIEA